MLSDSFLDAADKLEKEIEHYTAEPFTDVYCAGDIEEARRKVEDLRTFGLLLGSLPTSQ